MSDDSPWRPPSEADPASDADVAARPHVVPEPPPDTDVEVGAVPDSADAPFLPTLPPAAPPPPPPPPSAWAPGSESTFVVPPPAPVGDPAQTPPAPPIHPDPATVIVAQPAESGTPHRRSNWLVGSAVVAVLAVVAAGVFAIVNLRGSTASGSDTPADLGTELLNAIENEDVLGVIDVLVPGEREALGEPFVDLITELQRLDVLAETDLSDIAGLDVELSDEVVRTMATNVDDIVNISMFAEVVVSIDGAELPIGELVTDNMPDDMLTELHGTRVRETDQLDITLTAVLDDERWYFSLLHTLAETARGELTDEAGIPLQGVGSDGAPSPEAAVDQMLDRIEALDLTGIIRSLDPNEAAALQRYAPLFLEQAEAELAAAPLDWTIVDRTVRIEGSGDRRTAFIDALAIDGTFDGAPFSFSFSDECVVAEFEGERIEQCADVGSVSDVEDFFGDSPEILHLIEVVQAAFSDVEPIGLELRSRDGEWFVSPIASVTDAMLKVLRALDRQELDGIIAAVEPAVESITDGLFGATDDLFGSSGTDFAVAVEPDTAAEPSGGLPPEDEFGWFDCYELGADEATDCFQSYVGAGEIALSDIPIVLRHPECGYVDVGWGGGIYQLPDDEFIARAEAARGCFLDLVDAGQAEEWELPEEIVHLECFEGRNWYQVFDDEEYDLRFEACRNAAYGIVPGE